MQISVDSTGPLERQLKVEVPEARISDAVRSRLRNLSRNTRIDGFRPGKVPMKIVEKRFGGRVRQEVVGEVLRDSFREAVVQEKLRPAGEPKIDPLEAEPGSGLSYTATFEVYPEVSLAALEELVVEQPLCDIDDQDIDRMIETLRSQQKNWIEVERAAVSGDQVRIDLVGTVDGEAFEGGSQEDFEIELGLGRLIDGFEEGLEGAQTGSELELDLQFPEKYPKEELAGKPVKFAVKVKAVMESVLPELDEDFFKKFGVDEGGLEAFRAEVRTNMEREMQQTVRNRTKQNVMDSLVSANSFELPQALVQGEAGRLMQETRQRLMYSGTQPEQLENLDSAMFEQEARRRVSLGLMIAEIVNTNELSAEPAKVRARIETMASSYEDAEAVVKWYYDNPERLSEIESAVLEDEAVDWVLGRAALAERRYSFDGLMNPRQTDDELVEETGATER